MAVAVQLLLNRLDTGCAEERLIWSQAARLGCHSCCCCVSFDSVTFGTVLQHTGGAPALGPAAAMHPLQLWHLISWLLFPLLCSTAEERLYWEQWLVDVTVLPPPPADFEERNAFAASSLRAQRRQRVQVCRRLVAELRAAGTHLLPAACGGRQCRPHVRAGLGRRLLCIQSAGRCWAALCRHTHVGQPLMSPLLSVPAAARCLGSTQCLGSVPSLQAALEECLTQIVEKGAPLLCACVPLSGPLPRQQCAVAGWCAACWVGPSSLQPPRLPAAAGSA